MVETTQDDLRRLLRRLDPDPAVAWDMYLTLWQKLVMFFEHNNCHPASDHADEALSRIARRTDMDAIQNIGAFAWGVARKMKLEILGEQVNVVPFDDSIERKLLRGNAEEKIVEGIDKRRKVECIVRCLRELPAEERVTFVSFELADPETRVADRSKLAARRGMSVGTLRVSVFRTKSKLTRNVRKCLRTKG